MKAETRFTQTSSVLAIQFVQHILYMYYFFFPWFQGPAIEHHLLFRLTSIQKKMKPNQSNVMKLAMALADRRTEYMPTFPNFRWDSPDVKHDSRFPNHVMLICYMYNDYIDIFLEKTTIYFHDKML